jgi:hypothetical protein
MNHKSKVILSSLLGSKKFSKLLSFCDEVEKTWSAELEAANGSLLDLLDWYPRVEMRILLKNLPFTGKKSVNAYILFRLISLWRSDFFWRYFVDEQWKGNTAQRVETQFLTSLSDELFIDHISEYLTERRQNFLREILSSDEENISVYDYLLSERLFIVKIFKNNQEPKKVIRHKGYRDHGSLGSEFSQSQKQILSSGENLQRIDKEHENQLFYEIRNFYLSDLIIPRKTRES